jgi:hypothetical protein
MALRLKKARYPVLIFFALIAAVLFGSCSRLVGWGVLLWSSEDPAIPSGTVLPVYIRSNINHVWVAGIPAAYRRQNDPIDKFEVPLSQLELVGSKGKARKRAEAFSEYALTYAETLQDGLPIRDAADNGARRVYRLKQGEIIKVLDSVKGNPAISATGDPLPGEWLLVLTEGGSTGYCFSYRLKLFEHSGGPLALTRVDQEEQADPELDRLLAKTWSPEWYGTMVNTRRINPEELSRHWGFSPGQDTGMARIYLPTLDRTFSYTRIRPAGPRTWRFEGAPLQMTLNSDTILAVQYIEDGGAPRTFYFTVLPADVDDLIVQESARRESLFNAIYTQGPVYISANYGTLDFTSDGKFVWTGYRLLIPQIIPASALGSGVISMGLFLAPSLADRYDGAFSLRFDGIGSANTVVNFMYTLDAQGFRIEHVPAVNISEETVTRRAASPTVIYFFRDERSSLKKTAVN